MQASTNLKVRRPDFRLEGPDLVPFQWQPNNPAFGLFGNVFTFLAPAFERYIVKATRQALPRITDPQVAMEAGAFLRQEAQHAKAHQAHAKALIAQYAGLAETLAETNAAYDTLLESEDLEFHLAYVANLEATFPPLFRMVFENRRGLFEGGDERVGGLLLWHFVEEVEHRSSALLIHHHVTPSRWYRIRHARRIFQHVSEVYALIVAGFEQHVPHEACQVSPSVVSPSGLWFQELFSRFSLLQHKVEGKPMLGHVPGRDLRSMIWRLILGQSPGHNPEHEQPPEWVAEWHAAYDAGEDVSTYQGARL